MRESIRFPARISPFSEPMNNNEEELWTTLFQSLFSKYQYRVNEALSNNPATPGEILALLSQDPTITLQYNVAKNPATPEWVLEEFYQSRNKGHHIFLGLNRSAPKEMLERLSISPHYEVRRSVASNPATPEPVLRALGRDKEIDVLEHLAENPSCPGDVLHSLAVNSFNLSRLPTENLPGEDLREHIAENPSLEEHTMKYLLEKDFDSSIVGIGRNESTPPALLEEFFTNGKWDYLAAQNPNTPPEILETLSKDPSDNIRTMVAGNPSTPPSVLGGLARDISEAVRGAVAANPSTMGETIAWLSDDGRNYVLGKVASNPNTYPYVLENLFNSQKQWAIYEIEEGLAENPSTPIELLDKLAARYESVRKRVARNPSASYDTLLKLSADPSENVLIALATSLTTPVGILLILSDQDDVDVLRALASNNRGIEE